MQNKTCVVSMRKAKYGLVELAKTKLSCPHSQVLAQYYLDTLQRVDATPEAAEQEDDSNENTESKNGQLLFFLHAHNVQMMRMRESAYVECMYYIPGTQQVYSMN